MSEWISVKDRLPEGKADDVIVYESNQYRVMIGAWLSDESEWQDDECMALEVTHWMPLPEPPKAE